MRPSEEDKMLRLVVAEPDHRPTEDRNEEDVNDIHREESDNWQGNFVNVDSGNHNDPRSIKNGQLSPVVDVSSGHQTNETAISCQIFNFDDMELSQSEDC